MKFLCVPCDKSMTMMSVSPPDRGSLSVVYGCPDCGYEMAMLTNAHETQMVSSLGVKVGSAEAVEAGAKKCPFSSMIAPQVAETSNGIRWTAEASARMDSVPEFVRPMARSGIEKFAEESGYREIDLKVLDEARARFGM
ncbi:MAG TPA: PCP reductase family protein [Candidatus Polarisedimenticolaceae bacterium]|nr:PCP reductase family protein [Candidatus Polarisedimenticolaceae bacterium]